MQQTKLKDQHFNEIYYRLGLTKQLEMDLNKIDDQTKSLIGEFRIFLTEIAHHAMEYSETISKFFGRDHLIVKVIDINLLLLL